MPARPGFSRPDDAAVEVAMGRSLLALAAVFEALGPGHRILDIAILRTDDVPLCQSIELLPTADVQLSGILGSDDFYTLAVFLVFAADIHARYTQTAGRAGDFPARTAQFGRDTDGKGLNSFLRGNLNFWRLSEARMTDDGIIRYRQTRNHSTTTFVPDKTSGVLINRPDEQVTAPAYRITGPAGVPQLWRASAVRDAVVRCRRKPVVGWPAGWAHLMPDASVRFDPGGFPWSTPDIYTAEPADEPETWGPPCAECKYPDSEHDLSRLWPRSRADGSGHICWTYTRPQT